MLEDEKRLRCLGQERDIDEGSLGLENGAGPFENDRAKDAGGAKQDEISGRPKDTKRHALEAARRGLLGGEGMGGSGHG